MTIGNLNYHLPYHIKNLVRQLERLHRKIINNNYSHVLKKTYKKKIISIIYKCTKTALFSQSTQAHTLEMTASEFGVRETFFRTIPQSSNVTITASSISFACVT